MTPPVTCAPSRSQSAEIGVLEEVAWRQGFLTNAKLAERARPLLPSGYGHYLPVLAPGQEAQLTAAIVSPFACADCEDSLTV
jgi:hypothetical protein